MTSVAGGLRVATVVLVAAGLALGATRVDGSVRLAQPSTHATPGPGSDVLLDASTLVCPGQQRLGATGLRDVRGEVTVAAAAPPAGLVPGAAAGGAVSVLEGPQARGLALGDEPGSPVLAAVTGADAVTVQGTGGLAPGLVATQVWRHTGDDDRGLALTPCQPPASDVWLVGGGAGPSRTERLVVANAGSNAVTVTVDVLGRSGPVEATAARSVPVPPGSRVVLSLDALAPDEAGPVVHVTATGGVVTAVLDEQSIVGATARGIDDSTRAAAPSTELVVPGLDAAAPGWLRLGNPGRAEALAQVRLLTEQGPQQPDALRAVRVPPRSTVDVPVAAASGVFGLGIRSDRPLVAAAWSQRLAATGDRMGDFAWSAATPPVVGLGGVLLPELGRSTRRLLVTSADGATARVRTGSGSSGRTVTLEVPAGSSRAVDLGDADAVWVVPDRGELQAVVTVQGADAGVPTYAVAAVQSAPVTARTVPVRGLSR